MKSFTFWGAGARRRTSAQLPQGGDAIEALEVRLLPAATTIGDVVTVPSRTASVQSYDNVAVNPDGSYTVVFADDTLDSSGWGIYARRFTANGVPVGNQFRINSTLSNDQYYPSIATNGAGVSLVSWLDGFPYSIDFQFVNSNGTLLGTQQNLIPTDYYEVEQGSYVGATTWQYSNQPWTFADQANQFWVVVPIDHNYNYLAKQFEFWKISTDGTKKKAFETELIHEDFAASVQIPMSVQLGGDGTFYVCYDIERYEAVPDEGEQYTSQLLVRRISSSTGLQIGSDIVVHSATYFDDPYRAEHRQPLVIPESGGKFSVLYYNRVGDIVTQHFSANGNKSGSLVKLIDHAELNPSYYLSPVSVETLTNGNWLVAWNVGVAFGVDTAYVREFKTDGTPVGAAAELGNAEYFGVIHLAEQSPDHFVATWQDGGGSAGFGHVYARRLAANVAVAGVTVTPTSPQVTTEDGGTATFTVVLNSAPTQNVSVPLNVSDDTVASLSASQLNFTPANWNIPQTVTVTGLNDFSIIGDVFYDVELGPTFSADANYNNRSIAPLTFTNIENDFAGVVVQPLSGLIVSENAATATFSVVLTSQPFDTVSISVASSDATEGTVNKSVLTFTPANWNVPQIVTVTGVDDTLSDGDVPFQVLLGNAFSSDFDYSGLTVPDVSVTNVDNDISGVTVSPLSGLQVSETGTTSTFTVVLKTKPTANVSINVSSSDTTEGTVNKTSVVFTTSNWNVPQTVTVTGVNDDEVDGTVPFQVILSSTTSTDPNYNGLNVPDVAVTNLDNDIPGVNVSPQTVVPVSENGTTATLTLSLKIKPTANVTINASSTDTTEGTIDKASIVFTPANWNIPQTITITGVNDDETDGDKPFQIVLDPGQSVDPTYSALSIPNVTVVNLDNDVPGFIVTPSSGLQTTEAGGTAIFSVRLTTQPSSPVTINLGTTNSNEGVPSIPQLVFTPNDWDIPHDVTAVGVDDNVSDGNKTYAITLTPAIGSDPGYVGLTIPNVSILNMDNDLPVAPTLQLTGGTAAFGKKSAPVGLVTTPTVADDAPNFAGGRLTITIKSGYVSTDVLSMSTTVSGKSLGSLSRNGAVFVVNLNADATAAALESLLQSVKFTTKGKGLKIASRTIEFQVTDSQGAASNAVQRLVSVSKKKLK